MLPLVRWLIVVAAAHALVLGAVVARAETTFTYVKIADVSTPIPGGTGNFAIFGQPSVSGGVAVFRGEDSGGRTGIYSKLVDDVSPVVVRYDRTTVVPGTGGASTFLNFSNPSFDAGAVAFSASGTGGVIGVFTDVGGTLQVVANNATPIPGGSGTFTNFGWATVRGGEVVFRGQAAGQDGIYAWSAGVLRPVADRNTPVPGGPGLFTSFGPGNSVPMIDDGVVVFKGTGSNGERGVYRDDHGTLSVVADLDTPIPGGTGNFTDFDRNFFFAGNVRGGRIAFVGAGTDQLGIYLHDGAALSVIVDRNTLVPDSTATLFAFGTQGFGFDNGAVSFLGDASGAPQAIYTTLGGVLRITVPTTVLPGTPGNPPGQSFAYGTYGWSLNGNMLAFHVGNHGGTFEQAVYVAVASNDPPTAVNDAATVAEDGARTINVLANDSDPDGDVLSIVASTDGTFGKVTCTATACTYATTSPNFHGSDSFTYTVSDGRGGTSVGTVAVTIQPVDDADLGVTATASENPVGVGRTFTYRIVVTNAGPETARTVVVHDTLPAGTSLAAVKLSQGAVVPASPKLPPNTVVVALGEIAPRGSATIQLSVNVLSTAKDPITNVVEVDNGAGDDPDPRNNVHVLPVRVVRVGTFALEPADQTVVVGDRARLALHWTLPGAPWRELRDIQLRARDAQGTVLHVRVTEGVPMLVSLFNQATGRFGPPAQPGSRTVLSGPTASVYLAGSSVQAASSTAPTVTLTLDVGFKQAAGGRTFAIEVMASDDLGNVQDWEPAGTLTVLPRGK